jgi:hypothetical protein
MAAAMMESILQYKLDLACDCPADLQLLVGPESCSFKQRTASLAPTGLQLSKAALGSEASVKGPD